jgi:hypothetical protein
MKIEKATGKDLKLSLLLVVGPLLLPVCSVLGHFSEVLLYLALAAAGCGAALTCATARASASPVWDGTPKDSPTPSAPGSKGRRFSYAKADDNLRIPR